MTIAADHGSFTQGQLAFDAGAQPLSAEPDALRAENRRLRREAGDREALKRIRSDSGEGRAFTREELAEAWGISE